MLQNAYFLAKIGADTAENEQHFAEFLPTEGAARDLRRDRELPELATVVGVAVVLVLARGRRHRASARRFPARSTPMGRKDRLEG